MKLTKNNKGAALLAMLFTLVIVTALAAGAIMLATVQIKVAGGMGALERGRVRSEGDINYVIPLIQTVHYEGRIPPAYVPIVQGPDVGLQPRLVFELLTPTQWNNSDQANGPANNATGPNVIMALGGATENIDIDAIGAANTPGGSIEASLAYHKPNSILSGYRITAISVAGRYTSNMCQVIWLRTAM
jgi:hypothetical protein